MNDKDDPLDDALWQGLAEANPYDPEALAAHLPDRSGELMLREITLPERRTSPFGRLFRPSSAGGPVFGRAAFVGVLAAVAVAVVGLNIGLSRTDEADVAEPAGTASSTPSGAADGLEPLVVDPAIDPGSQDPDEAAVPPSSDEDPESDPIDGEAPDDGEETEDTAVAPEVSTVDPGCVSIELEDFELTGSWRLGYDSRVSGGAFATWEGLGPEAQNAAPADLIELEFTIDTPDTYRFVWAMRQPIEVGDSSADSSWVNIPDAARFGPIDGGSYGGFVPVSGRAKGEFDWSATADVDGSRSDVGVVFDRPGTYTLQLAGRSHGHELDRILLFPDSLSSDEAVNGSCAGT